MNPLVNGREWLGGAAVLGALVILIYIGIALAARAERWLDHREKYRSRPYR